MSDGPNKTDPSRSLRVHSPAELLVTRALSLVASRTATARGQIDERLMRKLQASLLRFERSARQASVAEMLDAGLTREEIVDDYIPEAARRLGELWCIDEVSFADVTIGLARLQSMLRDLGPAWSDEGHQDPNAPSLLLVVRQDQYHTLGAMVAASQLRRMGLSVRLSLGLADREVGRLAAENRFDAILISASSSETLESVRDLVKIIRAQATGAPPIVVGGTILETDRDVRSFTRADHATANPHEAIRLCGLRISTGASGSMQARI